MIYTVRISRELVVRELTVGCEIKSVKVTEGLPEDCEFIDCRIVGPNGDLELYFRDDREPQPEAPTEIQVIVEGVA